MEPRRVCVVGGSGFVGRHLVERLCAERYLVRVPAHRRENAKALILLPTVDVVDANVHDPEAMEVAREGRAGGATGLPAQ